MARFPLPSSPHRKTSVIPLAPGSVLAAPFLLPGGPENLPVNAFQVRETHGAINCSHMAGFAILNNRKKCCYEQNIIQTHP